ncbi:MAG: WD40 repeat domain-containing protein, partial [Bacteroidota bacterium]
SLPTNGKKIVAAYYSSATDSVIAGDEIGMIYRWSAEGGDVLSKKLVAKVDCLTYAGKGETFSLTTMGGAEVVAVSANDLTIRDTFKIPASLDVTCSAVDVDRKRAAITGAEKNGGYNSTSVYIVTNTEEKKLGEVQGLSYFMTLSGDGENVLLGSLDGELGLFNIETGAQKKYVMDRKDMATSVAISPDNTVLAAGDGKGIVHVWDIESGELKFEIGDDNDNISSLAFDGESKSLYSASRTGKGIGYLINGKYDPVVLRGKEFDSDSIFTSVNGDLLALTSARGSMEIWDVSKYPPVFLNKFASDQYTEGNPDIVRAVAFGANHDSVLFSVDPGQLMLWRFLDDKPALLVEKNEKWAKAIRAIDEDHFLLAYDDGSFLQVDSSGNKTPLNFGLSSVGSFEYVSRKNAIVVSDRYGDAVLIDLKTGTLSASYKEAGRKYGTYSEGNLKLSSDQTTAWVVGNDNIIRGWTLDSRELFAKIEASKNLHGETLRLADGYVGFVDTATGYIYDIGARRKFDLTDPMGIAVLDFLKDKRGFINVISMSARGDIR